MQLIIYTPLTYVRILTKKNVGAKTYVDEDGDISYSHSDSPTLIYVKKRKAVPRGSSTEIESMAIKYFSSWIFPFLFIYFFQECCLVEN